MFLEWSQDSSVSIVMGYGFHGQSLIPGRGMIFLFSIASRLVLGPPSLLSSGYRGLSPEIKWQGCEADHSPSSNAKVKNRGVIPPFPIHLQCDV
jgi:hypothetical protein